MQKTSFFYNSFSTEASKSFIVWKSIPLFFIINLQKEWEKQGIRRMSWENSARLSVNFARFARYRALLNTVQLRPINPNILPLQTKPFPEWFDISFFQKYEPIRCKTVYYFCNETSYIFSSQKIRLTHDWVTERYVKNY